MLRQLAGGNPAMVGAKIRVKIKYMRVLLSILLPGILAAAESYPVLAVPAADRVVLQTASGLPLPVCLAHVTIPEAQSAAARQALTTLLQGKRVELIYLSDFGVDEASGAARVQLIQGRINVNEDLVAHGLATYHSIKPDSSAEGTIRRAEEKARKAGIGQWATNPGAATTIASPSLASTKSTKSTSNANSVRTAQGPFCSELDNQFYYPTGAREVANVNAQRMIYYPDEGTAQKAGKRKPLPMLTPTAKLGTTEKDGDEAFAKGKQTCAQAIDAGNTPARDELYEKAYGELTAAMQIYSALVDQRPDDEKLGIKLRDCMQLRYGSVKMRRFH